MFLSVVLSRLRRWLRTRETARQLKALSDRELSDIGIARHDIARLCRKPEGRQERDKRSVVRSGSKPLELLRE